MRFANCLCSSKFSVRFGLVFVCSESSCVFFYKKTTNRLSSCLSINNFESLSVKVSMKFFVLKLLGTLLFNIDFLDFVRVDDFWLVLIIFSLIWKGLFRDNVPISSALSTIVILLECIYHIETDKKIKPMKLNEFLKNFVTIKIWQPTSVLFKKMPV